ncbi:MAG: ABC transporter substrate-binding protein [Candidatus Dormiibacterota bacterium]
MGVALAVVLLVTACGSSNTGGGGSSSSTGGGTTSKTLTVAMGINPDTLDPQAQTTTTVQQIVRMMVETLVTIDHQGKVQPLLATSWQSSSDGLTYTFTLRKGVKFQDGEPFNAQAVKFSLDRINDPVVYKAQPGVLTVIKDTVVLNDDQVKIDLKSTFPAFLSALSQATAGIIAPKSVDKAPNTPSKIQDPVGTGPYTYKEFLQDDHVTMTRFDGYWGEKPAYQTQTYKVVPEEASRESLIKAGQADVAIGFPANDLPALKADSSVKVILGQSDRTVYMAINTVDKKQPLLQNPKVREALNYAVDKNAIVKNALFGAGQVSTAPMSPALFGYCQTGPYPYDPAKAKQLLQQAGAEGMTIRMMAPQGRYINDYTVGQVIAGDLRKVGLNVTLANPMDWPSYLAYADEVGPTTDNVDVHMIGWAPSYLDATQQSSIMMPPLPPPGSDSSYYDGPKVTSLLKKANTEIDATQRKQDYCTAEKQFWSDAPWIFLYQQKDPILTTNHVTNVNDLPNEMAVTTWVKPA